MRQTALTHSLTRGRCPRWKNGRYNSSKRNRIIAHSERIHVICDAADAAQNILSSQPMLLGARDIVLPLSLSLRVLAFIFEGEQPRCLMLVSLSDPK